MIKRPLLLLCLFLVFTAGSMVSTVSAAGKGFYDNGKTKWEYLFEEGVISEARWYSEAGELISRETYVAGQTDKTEGYRVDGSVEWQVKPLEEGRQEVTRFDLESQKTELYQTVADQVDGVYTTFYSTGQAKQRVTYRQGVLNGPATTFFPSGQVEHEFSYSNGEVDGFYRTYSEEGKLLSEYTFLNGQLQ
jgi:antitoxin component YwqK of YwqJK toxin-antitoxin module